MLDLWRMACLSNDKQLSVNTGPILQGTGGSKEDDKLLSGNISP